MFIFLMQSHLLAFSTQLLSTPVWLAKNGLNLQWNLSQCLLKINTGTDRVAQLKNIQRCVINVNFEKILQKKRNDL